MKKKGSERGVNKGRDEEIERGGGEEEGKKYVAKGENEGNKKEWERKEKIKE